MYFKMLRVFLPLVCNSLWIDTPYFIWLVLTRKETAISPSCHHGEEAWSPWPRDSHCHTSFWFPQFHIQGYYIARTTAGREFLTTGPFCLSHYQRDFSACSHLLCVFMSVCLCVSLSVCFSLSLGMSLSLSQCVVCLSLYVHVSKYVFLSVCLCLSLCVSLCMFMCLSVWVLSVSLCVDVCLSQCCVSLSVCVSLYVIC